MTALVAVLDACVLYPMYLRDTLLRAAEAGLYEAHWSEDILGELRRNLVADILSDEQAQRLIGAMQAAFPEAHVADYTALVPAMRNQEKDRHVVAAAVRIGAQVIVTDNLRDFPPETLAPFGIAALSADAFLARLFVIDAEVMVALLGEQAASYRLPPRSPSEVLQRLAIFAPRFVELVRGEMGTGE